MEGHRTVPTERLLPPVAAVPPSLRLTFPPSLLLSALARSYARGMDNPYQSPREAPLEAAAVSRGGRAKQIPVVAILLIVQGALELLMGGFYLISGGIVATIMARQPPPAGNPNLPFSPVWFMGGMYAVMGFGALAVAALKIFAGWRNYSFRGRTWGVAALVSGMASLVTCYCFPTALLLMIYGLIVYLSADAAWAFSMGDQGLSRDQVLWHLLRDTSM